MIFPRMIKAAVFAALVSGFCFAQDTAGVKIVPNGAAAMDVGVVVDGYDKNAGDISNVVYERVLFRIGMSAFLGEKTRFLGSMEVKAFNEFPRLVKYGATRRYYYYYYLHQAELTRRFSNFFNINDLHLDVGGGYCPYKYNPYARNLGEYLFRSTAYPQILASEFDMPWTRLAALYAKSAYTIGEHKIALDIIANVNTEWIAVGDVNLSLVASYNYAHCVDIGAGVQFGSLISADTKATTPESYSTRYLNGSDTSQYYTFRGTKVMGRFGVDPKKLLPENSIFGEQDLKIYGEASLLGVKNYGVALHSPVWYNSILERIPVMLGFNLPACKFLDVLSFEGEWWGNRYPNSMEGVIWNGVPLPFEEGTEEVDSTTYKNDNWKWSLFGEKTFAGRYRVSFQAASDHMRTFAWDWGRQDWEESLRGPDKWYFIVRLGILF
ncbi:MAG: hypothetical protein JW699_04210 [Chitinispirillaceae bacterium]|nr:hypothetical protein [Chitinispirillaceae bacterium]